MTLLFLMMGVCFMAFFLYLDWQELRMAMAGVSGRGGQSDCECAGVYVAEGKHHRVMAKCRGSVELEVPLLEAAL